MKITILSILAFGIFSLSSCSPSESTETIVKSTHQSSISHNEGSDCLSCHDDGGEAKTKFTAAATVYEQDLQTVQPNAMVYLMTSLEADADTIVKIEVDKKGNFYTNEKINFGFGLFPRVSGRPDSTQKMSVSISKGNCGSCHGIANDRIWTLKEN